MKIAFVNTFPPTICGIATFSSNLIYAFQNNILKEQEELDIKIVAIEDKNENTGELKANYVIRQEILTDYIGTAKKLNNQNINVCIIQHEFGIYGGDEGIYILPFIHHLNCPVIVTLHTISNSPTFTQKNIIQKIGLNVEKIVVMNKTATQLLKDIYNIKDSKIEIIEHGFPDLKRISKTKSKDLLGIKQKNVLLSFGLLSRNKGIETALNALTNIIKIFPDTVYVVLGNTHPSVKRHHGDEYRNYLSIFVKEKNLEKHVQFHDEFVSDEVIAQYFSASDIFIAPYNQENQITSGTLSYAMGFGMTILTTPFIHAKELIKEDNGLLFDFNNSDMLGTKVIQLLSNPNRISTLGENIKSQCQNLKWEEIAKRYQRTAQESIKEAQVKKQHIEKDGLIDISLLPELNLAHLIRLTDDTGILQHAKYGVPNLKEGYCLDDNARALIAALMIYNQTKDNASLRLIPIYLSYIHYVQKPCGTFRNFISFSRQFLDEKGSEDGVWTSNLVSGLPC